MDCRTECDDVLESACGETINLQYVIDGRTGTIVIDSKTRLINRILTYFSNSANKSSAVEQKDHQVAFQRNLHKQRTVHKAEEPVASEVTAHAGGKILFSILTKTNDTKRHPGLIAKLNAELTSRCIELSSNLDLNRLKELLKGDEVRCWSEDEQMRGSGFTAADVVSFLLISKEIMSILINQEKIIAEKHGLAVLDDNLLYMK